MAQIKSILLAMIGGPEDEAAGEAAFQLAEKHECRVVAAVARPTPEDAAIMMIGGFTGPALTKVQEGLESRFKEDKAAARATFDALKERHAEVKAAKLETLVGPENEVFATRGKFADLIVMPHPAHVSRRGYRDTVETTLFGAGRPVLLIPAGWTRPLLEHVAVAWRGDSPAARALLGARPLLRLAEKVTVLSVGLDRVPGDSPEEASDYLKRHGVAAEPKQIDEPADKVADIVMSFAAESDASMLVMGASAHSHLRNLLLSSLTSEALDRDGLPILMMA